MSIVSLLDSATLELTLHQGYLWTWDRPAFTFQDLGFFTWFWGLSPGLSVCRQILYQLSYVPSPRLFYKTHILGARLMILGHTEESDRIWISTISGSVFLVLEIMSIFSSLGWPSGICSEMMQSILTFTPFFLTFHKGPRKHILCSYIYFCRKLEKQWPR